MNGTCKHCGMVLRSNEEMEFHAGEDCKNSTPSQFINRDDDDWMLRVAIYGTECQCFETLLNSRDAPLACIHCEHLNGCYSIVDQIENGGQPLDA